MKAVKETERKYYKYQYKDWVQPVLTANGTMGGDSFAVRGANSGSNAYLAYDGNASTYLALWSNLVNETYFYNPKPLKITTLNFTYYPSCWISKGEIYGSNDDSLYTLLTEFSHSGNTGTVEINNETPYKYFKIKVISANGNNGYGYLLIANIYELKIDATQQTIIDGTESDHDFYKDIDTYKLPKIGETYYGIGG